MTLCLIVVTLLVLEFPAPGHCRREKIIKKEEIIVKGRPGYGHHPHRPHEIYRRSLDMDSQPSTKPESPCKPSLQRPERDAKIIKKEEIIEKGKPGHGHHPHQPHHDIRFHRSLDLDVNSPTTPSPQRPEKGAIKGQNVPLSQPQLPHLNLPVG